MDKQIAQIHISYITHREKEEKEGEETFSKSIQMIDL